MNIFSNTNQVRIVDVSQMMDNVNVATVIPALSNVEIHDEEFIGEMPKKDVALKGYAVLKDFKLAGYIDENYSRGLNFITN